MIVRIIALTSKAEGVLSKYIQSSKNVEEEMNSLSRVNPRRLKFEFEQRQAKKFVVEESFENPLMITATINSKYASKVYMFVPEIERRFNLLMSNGGCGKEDYIIEVL